MKRKSAGAALFLVCAPAGAAGSACSSPDLAMSDTFIAISAMKVKGSDR